MPPYQEITMLYLHQNYPTHPFFDIDSSPENRDRVVKSAQDFLVILGAEGRMVLAAGVLCGNPEPSHLAYLLQSKYGESKSKWTERHVEHGFILMLASPNEFNTLFNRCQQNQRWLEYDNVLRDAYQNLDFKRKPSNPEFKHNPEDVVFLHNNRLEGWE
ncbi:hypothetical protein MMC22_004764 [Lobaria immixta]|nr:hypothetical protein [Lobaria immixta]